MVKSFPALRLRAEGKNSGSIQRTKNKTVFRLFALVPALVENPNIVLIPADDMDRADLGCCGSEIPSIGTIAKQGMQPSRCSPCRKF